MRNKFRGFLAKYGKSRIAIVTHNKADVDSISSAYALTKILPNSVICTHEEMRVGAKMLAEKLGIRVRDLGQFNKKDFDGVLAVDTAAYTLVPEARGWKILGIIDHHRKEGKDIEAEFEIIEEESPSAAEIVAGLLDEIDKDTAFALCVGIIADGARFKSARGKTFEALGRLMKIAGADYKELLTYAEPEPPMEVKIAMLTAMKRVEFVYSAGYVIATSEVGSNESDAASLIADAADVAFVGKWKDREQETRISARARKNVHVALNEVMGQVGKELGGAGGGHPKAAGAAIKAHSQETLQKCVDVFIRMASG
jgi:nanoRNase/pAp phosphatase (c-di-AMP/oligoRNAs hydrolase)